MKISCSIPSLMVAMCVGFSLCACGGGSGSGGPVALEKPTGDFIAFVSDGRSLGTNELFVSNADGTDVRCVSGDTVPGADVIEFAWSPNHQWLAYTMDRDLNGPREVYVIDPANDAVLTTVTTTGTLGTGFQDIQWDPSSHYVGARSATFLGGRMGITVFGADVPGIYTVVDPIVANGDVSSFKFQPGGDTRIAFLGDIDTDGRVELFTVDRTGTNRVKICQAGWPFSDVFSDYAWSYNGAYLAYRGDLKVDGRDDLYTNVPLGGQQAIVSDTTNADRDVLRFAWPFNSTVLAYTQDVAIVGVQQLFAVPAAGGARVNLSTLPKTSPVSEFAWSPTGIDIAFTAGGGADLFLSHPNGPTEGVVGAHAVADLRWSRQGTQLFFTSEDQPPSPTKLNVLRTADGVILPLGQLDVGTSVDDVQWSRDSSRLLVRADGEAQGVTSLYVTDVAQGATTLVFDPGNAAHDVTWAGFSRDSSTIAWIGGSGFVASFWTDVYTALADATSVVKLTDSLSPLSTVLKAELK